MGYYNHRYLAKYAKIVFGLYGALTVFVVIDSIITKQSMQIILLRAAYLLPFVLICFGFCLIGVQNFKRSVRAAEQKYGVIFSAENPKTVDSARLVFATDEWLIVAGKYAAYFRDIAEMSDPISCPAFRAGGKIDQLMFTMQNGEKRRISGDDLMKLSFVKTAWVKAAEGNHNPPGNR